MPDVQEQLSKAGKLTGAMLDILDQVVDQVLGKQAVDKDGKPLRQVAYMHMPSGLPIDPRQYANPWTPAGGATLAQMLKDGTLPAPERPPEVRTAIEAAQRVLYNLDADGNIQGPSNKFQNYLRFSQTYADAKADFARQESAAMADPILGGSWPVTAASLQQKVDNAYKIWRTSGADDVEKAVATLNSEGGSAAAYFAAQSRELFDKWDLSLSGVVAAKTPYTQITPASWYDHTDQDIGFAILSASVSESRQSAGSSSSSFAKSWYSGQSQSTEAGGFGSFMGITVGGAGGHSSSESSNEGHQGGEGESHHEDRTTSATIKLEYGVVNIQRPWLLTELLHIGGWYIPGQPIGCVSDGTIAGQAGDDQKLLPMITTQALVIRNVEIVATGWGDAGQALQKHFENQAGSSSSSSWNAGGTIGFMGFGGAAKHQESEWAGSQSSDAQASWGFTYDAFNDTGTLSIRGSQIAGYVGEIVGLNPRVDGGTPDEGALPKSTADTPATPAPAGGKS